MKRDKKLLPKKNKPVTDNPVPREVKRLPPFKPNHLSGILLGIIAFFLYFNSINAGYVLDDAAVIMANGFVQKGIAGIPDIMKTDLWYFFGLKLGYYRPLSLITFALENQFFGNNPTLSHAVNVVIYSASAYLLFILLSRVFRSFHFLFPFIITLLFIMHPIHTEVVANIKSRDELLSYLNLLLMLLFAYKYADTKKISSLLLSCLFLYLALLSKETGVTGIALLPALMFFSERMPLADALKKAIPYVLVLIVFLIQKKMMLGTLTGMPPNDIVNYPYTETSIKIPTVNLLFAISLKLLLVPHPLRYDYSFNQIPGVDFSHPGALIGIALFIAGAVAVLKYYKTRAPLILGLLVLYINLTPGLGFTIVRGGIFAERLLFLPSLGFSIAIAALAAQFLKSDFKTGDTGWIQNIKTNFVFIALFVIISALYSFKTVTRNFAWKDEITLYRTDISSGLNCTQNLRHYGTEMMKLFMNEKKDTARKNYYKKEALASFYRAVHIHPAFGEIYNQLGVIHKEGMANVDSGIYYFNKSIQVSPGFAVGYYNLGTTYQSLGQNNVASYYYNESLKYNPAYPDAIRQKEYMKKTYGLDVQVNPLKVVNPENTGGEKNSAYYYNLGNYFAARGDYAKALEQFQASVNLDATNIEAKINLGNCYGMLQQYEQSIRILEEVVSRYPDNGRAIENLATTYKNSGNNKKAEEYTKKANALRNN